MLCGFYTEDKECTSSCRYWNTCTRSAKKTKLQQLRREEGREPEHLSVLGVREQKYRLS